MWGLSKGIEEYVQKKVVMPRVVVETVIQT